MPVTPTFIVTFQNATVMYVLNTKCTIKGNLVDSSFNLCLTSTMEVTTNHNFGYALFVLFSLLTGRVPDFLFEKLLQMIRENTYVLQGM